MTSVVPPRRGTRSSSRSLSASSASSHGHSDPEGQDGESEYGSAERSGSDLSDRESIEGLDDERKQEDGQNAAGNKSQVIDHDQDRRNPQYIPKKGTFYEHDDRTAAGGDPSVAAITENVAVLDISRNERVVEKDEKSVVNPVPERRKTTKTDRWLHDKYNENDQTPKSSEELKAVYGYDIRGEEGPPKALRRHRYGRGPNKYTRNWEDENAYGKNMGIRPPKPAQFLPNGKDFPALQSKNEKNRIEKRRNDRKIRVVDNKITHERSMSDKMHDNKVFTNKTSKIERELAEKAINEELPKWKNRGQLKNDNKKPIVIKNQSPPEQKWPETPKISSPPKTVPIGSNQAHNNQLPAMVPLQENKLPPARKINQQNQVPPRMQGSSTLPPASVTSTTTVSASDSATRGKRYSSIRQRPMPDNYQQHQQQYINEYQQSLPKQSNSQQQLSNITSLPLQQTPPPMLQTSAQHHQPIPQLHQQTPPPAMHQSSSQLHQQTNPIHQQTPQIIQQTTQIHQQTQQIIQQTPQLHQQTPQLHQTSSQIHQQNTQLLQQNAQILQAQSNQLHQPNTQQIHQQSSTLHQQTPPPTLQQTQTHHQTPPPAHQSISRQQASLPMRQVPRTHQQQIALHTMSMPQGGLVSTQSYAAPQIMTQNQYIQGANGAVYGHVVSQVYPSPQAYAATQHQTIPQGIPPQALTPQALPPQAMAPQALAPQPLPPQAMPPQAIPQQAIPPHSYHHQTPAPQHQSPYVAHTGRSVFREPSGITYYSPQEQKGATPPTRRPTSAIPILPPPPKERGKLDSVPPPTDNIDHIVDNMFVPRQGRTPRPGETPPRSMDAPIAKQIEDVMRLSEEKIMEEKNASLARMETQMQPIEIPQIPSPESKPVIENTPLPVESFEPCPEPEPEEPSSIIEPELPIESEVVHEPQEISEPIDVPTKDVADPIVEDVQPDENVQAVDDVQIPPAESLQVPDAPKESVEVTEPPPPVEEKPE